TGQAPEVTLHPEVVVMAPQTTAQRGVLHLHRLVPVAPAPGVDGPDGPSQARPPCLAPQPPTAPPGPPPVQREPQEVEGGRTLPRPAVPRAVAGSPAAESCPGGESIRNARAAWAAPPSPARRPPGTRSR